MSDQNFPTRARVVVIGGGVMGLSTAYHLAKQGVQDVVLVERGELGAGSTCKAAGGVRAQFSDAVNIELGMRSLEVFRNFPELFDQDIDLDECGYLFLLEREEDLRTFERNVELQRSMGLESRITSVEEAKELSPLISTEGLIAGVWSPEAGHCTPESVVQGYARAARALGVRIIRHCEVTDVVREGDTITSVETAQGSIATDTVVCCAGAWSRALGDMVGVDLPVDPVRRELLVTEPMPDLPANVPFTIDFSTTMYFHREGPGLLVGMSNQDEEPGFSLEHTDEWLEQVVEAAGRRVPVLEEVGMASRWAGLYEVTPDHNALIGEAEGVSRFLYATGFSGHGFLQGPAVGQVMAELYLGQTPSVDVTALHGRRFEGAGLRPEFNIV
ncbi:FAD-binding oxidoreductase [Kytococcus sedentarius]|uniref:Glycine/D-amino acid oxidase, deaminating n=1 Tax=Kytococcus sedentarius (strain ATCC 14392 / DSM 20547 / JCM 11482 / CCUG 33030 / NBRC 15357 / NCTC 11040 / CCM 314 / 541) TaxID=478801 RepID=C7NKM2_KYTSD|nr:FAD-binding oxidoreductase [Kytococcus sedentarius]ACV05508.1 glycine/D-amino acid oxidase, deaminating [Kytococcus sedentarius DSM 20547]QQB63946.1 FAD-binding oxidoreductase [Kytococcus sedentarius]STX13079.1 Sarcosine oxidase subunit beta [Kytococcus sedentarius]